MLTTIEATYENGQIIWEEQPPVQGKTKVLITFIQEGVVKGAGQVVRKGGSMKGEVVMSDTFNEPLDDLKEYM